MADDEPEDLVSVGSERRALLVDRLRRHWMTRTTAAVLALAVVVLALVTVRHDNSDNHSTAQKSPGPTPTSSSASRGGPAFVDNEYLYAVPAQDLRAELRTKECSSSCVANDLHGRALARAASSFRDLSPLAGGTVTRADGTVIFQTIEALARPDALVHLVLRKVSSAGATRPSITQRVVDGSRTVVIRLMRGGWQLTATLVVRGSVPPSAAALVWGATAKLPDAAR